MWRPIGIALLCSLSCMPFRNARSRLPDVILEVRNHSFFDVNVYALPSPASQTRVRLGNVIGFENARLRVPAGALRQGRALAIYLHAIGSNRFWVSPEVSVSPDLQPCLDIHATLDGDLTMSVLYSRVASVDTTNHLRGAPRVDTREASPWTAPLMRSLRDGAL